ncbi:MAG: hypothetical protein IJX93_11045 [Clostridia bacterium]|nr:hypothetical protein [Clostridia bacterium]MBQ8368539.1 hypothetical protein [Clostridia bacterium]MBQ8513374.1 hypothetical protein [Clostridia bacterium]
MKILKTTGKICLGVLTAGIALAAVVVGGLNIAKFAIYRDYYAAESALCRNPGLSDGFVCQGISAADEAGLILVSGYMKDGTSSRIYVTTTDSESYYVTLHCDGETYTGHAGGIAVSGDTAYIANGSKIFSFPLSDVLGAENGDSVNIGQGVKVNNKASFLYTDDEYLYVGSYMDSSRTPPEEHVFETAEGTHKAICSVYAIGDLSAPVRVYSIRDYVQGICFTPDGRIVLSTSHGLTSSVYYVYNAADAVDSGNTFDGVPVFYLDHAVAEITGPAMAEGMDYFRGSLITLTESASDKYIFGKLFFANDLASLDLNTLLSK